MKMSFVSTPHNTIRVFVEFRNENEKISFMQGHNFYTMFESLSIWRGYDKNDEHMLSWELSKTLKPFIEERFKMVDNCVINLK